MKNKKAKNYLQRTMQSNRRPACNKIKKVAVITNLKEWIMK